MATLSPRRCSVIFFQLSIRGAMASTVSGSSARRNSSACSEKHHAKAPGGAGGVLLKQVDIGAGVTLFPEVGEIQPAGASADHGDTHDLLPGCTYCTANWESASLQSEESDAACVARHCMMRPPPG